MVGAWQGGGADCRQGSEALQHLPGGRQAARPAHQSHVLLTHGLQVPSQIFATLAHHVNTSDVQNYLSLYHPSIIRISF